MINNDSILKLVHSTSQKLIVVQVEFRQSLHPKELLYQLNIIYSEQDLISFSCFVKIIRIGPRVIDHQNWNSNTIEKFYFYNIILNYY